MKKLFIIMTVALSLTACGNKTTNSRSDNDSVQTEALNPQPSTLNTPQPMFLYCLSAESMQVVYWTEYEKPDKKFFDDNDMSEYYEPSLEAWTLQDMARSHAEEYTKVLTADGKWVDIKYVGEQLKDPDGKKIFFGELHSRHAIPSAGLKYALANADDPMAKKAKWQGMNLIVTDSYLETHKLLSMKQLPYREKPKAFPQGVLQQLEKQYGMKTQRSVQGYTLGDRYTYGIVQFKPKNNKVIALEVLTDGDKTYALPKEGQYDPEDNNSTWNVDDGGEYPVCCLLGAFDGPEGVELYYLHPAPESSTVGRFILKDGKMVEQEYSGYHNMIDEQTPLWKKDLTLMRELYLQDDRDLNKHYTLTKYMPIDIDNDGYDEFWLRAGDDKHGALFTCRDGKVELIGVETEKRHVTFMQSRNGKGYVQIAGSAGGPSIYTQVVAIQKSKVAERFNMLEVEGEITEASLNGRTINKSEAANYLDKTPDKRNPYIYFIDIREE